MEIYAGTNQRHSRTGGNPGALVSRLRGNDGMLFPAARLRVTHRQTRLEEK